MDALAARLESLERTVGAVGPTATVAGSDNTAKQVSLIAHKLDKTIADYSSFQQLLDKYEKLRNIIEGDGDLELSRQLLGVTAKTEMILLNDDIQKIMSDLHIIRDLQPRINQPEYAAAASNLPLISQLEKQHEKQTGEFKHVVADISSLVDRYQAEMNALSEMFISWEQQLSAMERKVDLLSKRIK
ncbi:hypothetical protein LPJ78_004061 [Coemansia sp. RSA 989]|nr:hypothetical protein LPJ78_004061 [Coemansia sp. RSA 989]